MKNTLGAHYHNGRTLNLCKYLKLLTINLYMKRAYTSYPFREEDARMYKSLEGLNSIETLRGRFPQYSTSD